VVEDELLALLPVLRLKILQHYLYVRTSKMTNHRYGRRQLTAILGEKMGQCGPFNILRAKLGSGFGQAIFRHGDRYEPSPKIVLWF